MAQRPSYTKTGDIDFNLDSLKLIGGFVARSIKRHRKLGAAVFGATMVLTLVAMYFMPPLYRVTSRILTHTNYLIPALATPTRSIPWQAQSAVDGAVEVIKSRENLRGIIQDANIAGTWEETRTPIGRVLDRLREAVFGEMSADDKENALISLLDQRFSAFVEDEKIVVMSIEWHDPGVAVRILETAQTRFLEGRKNRELSEINETVKILERQAAEGEPALEKAADRIREVAAHMPGARVIQRETPPPEKRTARPSGDVSAKVELEEDLRTKRAAITDMERGYHERVRGAQEHLNKLRGGLGPNHPDVINATRNLELQASPPSELASLKADEARLSMQLSRMLIANGASPQAAAASVQRPVVTVSGGGERPPNPDLDQAMAEYERVENSQSELFRRLENARIEVQTATAGFLYRYLITQPPVYPRKTVKPNKPMIMMGGFVAALFLAIALAVAADIISGRIVEPWQVPRFIGVPLLGEIREPPPRLRS